MTKLIKAAVLGGVVVHLWGVFSWMVLPWHAKTIQSFNHDADVAAVMDFATSSSGVFAIPNPGDRKSPASPLSVFAIVSKTPLRPMAYSIIMGLLMNILGAFMAAWMLSCTRPLTYKQKILFVVVFGVSAGWMGNMPYFIWWNFPADYTAVALADALIGWTLAGLVMGKTLS